MTSQPSHQPSRPASKTRQAEALYALGQLSFERGNYRQAVVAFEQSIPLAGSSTVLGGAIQLWLMNAYSAANRQSEAIALGQRLSQHPDREVRKESKRLLEILQAPPLRRRAEWLTPIPDLSHLDDGPAETATLNQYATQPASRRRPAPEPPLDPSQINTRDNGFLWIALGVVLAGLGGAWFLG